MASSGATQKRCCFCSVGRLATDEGAAFGAAILAGMGAGIYDDVQEAVARSVKLQDDLERPIPLLVEQYEEIYHKYVSLYPALKSCGVWKGA